MSPQPVIGVDAGGTKLLAGALTDGTEVHQRVYRRWGGGDRDEVLATMVEAVDEVRAGVADVGAVGFGIPSLVQADTGVSVSSVHLPLADVPFRDVMRDRIGLPVFVDNDVNLAALAEQRRGAGSGARVMVMLTLGTGIGGAIVIDGRVFRGADGAAGELGHMTVDLNGPPCQGNCPNRGCLEVMASGSAIGREGQVVAQEIPHSALGRALAQGVPITGELVTDLALNGDLEAQEVMALVGSRLGAGLVGIVNALNPDVVVIGGGASRAGDLLLDPARRVVAERALRPSRDTARIVPATFGQEAGVVGAALFAREGRGGVTGKLVVCPTPIGNLEDVTLRVLSSLREADVVACEDTRHTRVLLDRYGVSAPLVSYHEHNEDRRSAELVERMRSGDVVALVSDAGMPLVSDPGYVLVRAAVAAGLPVEVLPGPSAAIAALVASALPADAWRFVGFLPRKKGDLRRLFEERGSTLVAFESPRRVPASLAVLAEVDPERRVAVARELTKAHEEVVRGTARELAERYGSEPPRGEVVLVVAPSESAVREDELDVAADALARLVEAGARPRPAAAIVADLTGAGANAIYRAWTERRRAESELTDGEG